MKQDNLLAASPARRRRDGGNQGWRQLLHTEVGDLQPHRSHCHLYIVWRMMSALLLQLPPEVLLEIIELLHEDYRLAEVDWDPEVIDISWLFTEQVEGRRGNPLEALRLYGSS